jgi:uncharacterized protein with gpF-like domain
MIDVENEKIISAITPTLEEITEQGIMLGLIQTGMEELALSERNRIVAKVVASRTNFIKDCNTTTWNKIQAQVVTSHAEGETVGVLSDRIMNVFDEATASRAKTIARTESASVITGATFETYREAGVQGKSWITAGDGEVRESHVECEAQGVIPLNQKFINGLAHPGDPGGGPEEVINCRCGLIPEVIGG